MSSTPSDPLLAVGPGRSRVDGSGPERCGPWWLRGCWRRARAADAAGQEAAAAAAADAARAAAVRDGNGEDWLWCEVGESE